MLDPTDEIFRRSISGCCSFKLTFGYPRKAGKYPAAADQVIHSNVSEGRFNPITRLAMIEIQRMSRPSINGHGAGKLLNLQGISS